MLDRSAPITAARDFPDSAAPVRNLDKDLAIVTSFAESEGLALGMARMARDLFAELMEQGKTGHDIAGVLEIIEQHSGK